MSDMSALLTSGPLRIGLLTHSVNPRGGVVHVIELAQALHDAGHSVTVMAPALPGQQFFRALRCETALVPVSDTPPDMAEMIGSRIDSYTRHLRGLLAHRHFDVLHAHDGIGGNALANLQADGWPGGVVRTVHHLDPFDNPQIQAWQLRGFRQAGSVLCVSRLWCDVLQREHGIRATEVHNGVDCQRFSPNTQASDAAVIQRYGLRGSAAAGPVVLMVGGIEERKNTVRLLEAFIQLRRQLPGAQLVVAGGASLLNHDRCVQDFRALLAAHGIKAGPGQPVVLTGPVPDVDMPALFRLADVVAMPSTREGFGLVVLESLASGTPVVVSRIEPFTQYLAKSDCHWADPYDADSIATSLHAALAKPKAAQSSALAHVAARLAQRFSWPGSAQLHLNAYRRLLARQPDTFPGRQTDLALSD